MKSLSTYINEKLIIKQKTTPTNKQELVDAILDYFNNGDGDLNNIDVSKIKEKDFECLFYDLIDEIEKNKIIEIDISKWKLKELYFDESNYIGMFDSCETLETIILPDCLEVIGNFAFCKCRKLDNIIIPNSVNSINDNAFQDCNSLHSIIIPNSVTYICSDTFYDCPNLIIIVPNERVKKLVLNSGFDGKIIIKK